MAMALSYRIEPTDRFVELQALFHKNGLEIDLSIREPVGVLGLWQAVEEGRHERIGAVKLELRGGEFVVSGIAVEPAYRRSRVGAALLQTAVNHARSHGAGRVLLVAKVPAFFKAEGFHQVDMAEFSHVTKCYACPQRGESCFPEVLCRNLD